ncbi:MAG: hypothetical protein J6N76_05960 [Lachnospiraceae bacterium]|nr:hypothetical protein [Lachnospiraceae bacterium]
MQRTIIDKHGRRVVVINSISFRGKQHINWDDVELFLKKYVGQSATVSESSDVICIERDFPAEYKGSLDTTRLRGGNAKAKANAATVLIELIENATNKRWQENHKDKHSEDAKYGWYRFTSRFALPVFSNAEKIERYNIYRIEVLTRVGADERLYLYDLVNIKKETSTPF